MSEKISAVTPATELADVDLFALAKYTGAGPTGFASRHVTVETMLEHIGDNVDLTNNNSLTTVVENLIDATTTTDITEGDNLYFTQGRIRTIVEEETGTTYTFVLEDANHKWKKFTNAEDITVTMPPDSDVAWPDHTYIELEQGANGTVYIVEGVGVTIDYNENLSPILNGDFAVAGIKKTGANRWNVFGNLVPA